MNEQTSAVPPNPYKPHTIKWALMADDWSDLTTAQIAEVLDVSYFSVKHAMTDIRRETGYIVPHAKESAGRKAEG